MQRQVFQFEEFQLDIDNRQLRRGGETLNIPAKAFDLLQSLLEKRGRLVSKDELFASVWHNQIVEESNLTVHISQIRKALGETKKNPRFIETVPGYGYRFIGDVREPDDELIIETETLSRITIETESANGFETAEILRTVNGDLVPLGQTARKIASSDSEAPQRTRFYYGFGAAAAILICLGLGLGFYFLRAKKTNPPFEKVKFTRLTNNGKISTVSLSSDGKFIAYVLSEPEGNSLWVRQTGAANDTRILPPVKEEFWGLTFTPDGTEIYYNLFGGEKTDTELFRIPTLGGVSQSVPNITSFAISFSPDGRRFTYIQPDQESNKNYLMVADADGTNKQVIAEKPQPNTFVFDGDFTAWSPDGETIACLVNNLEAESNYNSLVGVSVKDGTERSLSPQKWYEIRSFEWLKDGSGLLVSGSQKNASKNQIWIVSASAAEARPITDDFNDYEALGTATKSDSFIALQYASTNSIAVGEADNFKEIVSEVSPLYPLVWTIDGKIVFRSMADGSSNLWMMDADGANRRQLTADAQVNERGMCLSSDGKYIVFVSWRSGKSNLWRVDADGKNLTQLTNGEADAYPSCSPDGQSIVYQRGILSQPRLWKISINGGEPVQLTDFRAKWAAVSGDGNLISFFHMVDSRWKIGFLSADGKIAAADLSVPANLKESKVYWSADNQNLFYIGGEGNVGNIWSLARGDSQIKPLTNLKNHTLTDFALSADKKRLALAQNMSFSDVVLITEIK